MDDSGQILYKVLSGLGGTDPDIQKNEDLTPLSQLCRICALPNEYLIPIFEGEGQENSLADKIHSHLPIRVNSSDDYPDHVCYQCASTLLAFHDLVDCCKQANITLTARVQLGQSRKTFTKDANQSKLGDASQNNKERSAYCHLSFHAFQQAQKAILISLPRDRDPLHTGTVDLKRWRKAPVHSARETRSCSKPKRERESNKDNKTLLPKGSARLNDLILEASRQYQEQDIQDKVKVPFEIKEEENSSDSFSSRKNLDYTEIPVDSDVKSEPSENLTESKDVRKRGLKVVSKSLKETLEKVKIVIDGRKVYECPVCSRQLHAPHSYIHHQRIHSGEKPCVCHLCGKQFRITAGLRRHVRETHQKIKNHSCTVCPIKFTTRQNMAQHMRIHTGERPYVCSQCGKCFKQSASLHIHTKIHTDHFPFACTSCDAKYRFRAQLTHHTYLHTGEKPYVCDVCSQAFRVRHELKMHRTIHFDDKPFSCADCGLAFRQKRYLRNHRKRTHTRPPETPVS